MSVPEHAKVFPDKAPLVRFGVVICAREQTLESFQIRNLGPENSLNNEKQILKQSDAHTHAISMTVHHRAGVFPPQIRRGWSHS